ncbi:MAG: hypothetical protein K2F83_03430 [Oscillospiraceae bacterium]|nr:hypothetical protein [Oscillospiraceae bacterium]
MVNSDVLFFFDGHMEALPLYEAFAAQIEQFGDVTVRVQKTQITFSNRHNFVFVSFLPARKAKDRPKNYITVTFGLDNRVDSPRIDIATEPYPNRWTHHVLISSAEEIDKELMGWVKEAYDFSSGKR